MLASSTPSVLYINICRASLGLALSSWLTYITDMGSDSSTAGSLSLPHLGAAALTLFLFPSETRTVTYIIYWAIITLRPCSIYLVSKFPQSFSFGEAMLICQSLILLTASMMIKLFALDEISLKAIAIVIINDLKWFTEYLLDKKIEVFLLVVFWLGLIVLSVAVVALYNQRGWTVNTRTRKIFHLAIVLVYISGLAFSPILLYLCSVAAFILMVSVEAVRWSNVYPPVSSFLSSRLKPFLDLKDSGSLILTNIYLLVGVSWPLWIYPSPLHQLPSPLVLYTGVLSVGVADSAASIVGSIMGRITWGPNSSKTIEGSVAGAISSIACAMTLSAFNLVVIDSWSAFFLSVVGMVLTEALSNQVDNLTLPLVMYGLLSWFQYMAY